MCLRHGIRIFPTILLMVKFTVQIYYRFIVNTSANSNIHFNDFLVQFALYDGHKINAPKIAMYILPFQNYLPFPKRHVFYHWLWCAYLCFTFNSVEIYPKQKHCHPSLAQSKLMLMIWRCEASTLGVTVFPYLPRIFWVRSESIVSYLSLVTTCLSQDQQNRYRKMLASFRTNSSGCRSAVIRWLKKTD